MYGAMGKGSSSQGKGRGMSTVTLVRGNSLSSLAVLQGNAILKTQPARAVAFYTQAICLDSENPVYYLNRAVRGLTVVFHDFGQRTHYSNSLRLHSTLSKTTKTQRSTVRERFR
jgi:hypothetical protein